MVKIILVHGSCFGAWAWDRLTPHLTAMGHDVRAIDLPGRDGEATGLVAQGHAVLDAIPGQAVLIGHSAGGYPISMAAELAPQKVTGLVYLTGYVPRAGASVADLRRAGPSQPMQGHFRLSPDRRAYGFAPDAARGMFFHDCPDAQALTGRLCLEPIAPQETAFPALTHAPVLPRAAIIATKDRAVPADWQRAMAQGLDCHEIVSGHCPHLAQPIELSLLIGRILRGWHQDIP